MFTGVLVSPGGEGPFHLAVPCRSEDGLKQYTRWMARHPAPTSVPTPSARREPQDEIQGHPATPVTLRLSGDDKEPCGLRNVMFMDLSCQAEV